MGKNKVEVSFILNGREITMEVDPEITLLTLLREELRLTGTKKGCGIGECGACTVIMDGKAVNSCILLAGQVNGTNIITVEGLAENGELDILQKMFIEHHAVQCGFCTPGMLMSAKALLMKNPNPSDEEIRTAISGNLCRCTGYESIKKAIRAAADNMAEQRMLKNE